jgi:hypothetical protein
MKRAILIILTILVIPSMFALSLNIEEQSSRNVIILGLEKPAIFDLSITNYGESDNLIFYTFFTPNFFPKGTTPINSGENKIVRVEVYPPEKVKTIGYQTFDYYIKSQDGSEIKQSLMVNAINLEDAFEIGSGEIDSESETMTIYIHSKVNFDFKNVSLKFSSPFFKFDEMIDLEPNKRKDFTVELDKGDYDKLMAGFYTMSVEIKLENLKTTLEAPIKFIEKDILTETSKDSGIIINTKIITKTNEGNVISSSETIIKKNIISRLFTTFSPEPTSVNRQGFKVYYSWNAKINPGEVYEIKVKTNGFFPFILILLLVSIAVITKYFSTRNLVLRKRVSFVKTKGGEFALKVSVIINAKKYIEKVNIIERLPPLVKLHDRFGSEVPSRIDEKNRRVEWRFDKLQEGETRILSYIMYSKVGVVGKFALPRTTALFEREGKILERNSNQTFFVIEQNAKREE